jgi:hypothetical protein
LFIPLFFLFLLFPSLSYSIFGVSIGTKRRSAYGSFDALLSINPEAFESCLLFRPSIRMAIFEDFRIVANRGIGTDFKPIVAQRGA